MTQYYPSCGDVVLIDFSPQSGHEQLGKRPGLVISSSDFNRITGFAVVCPITNQQKGYPFEVIVEGAKKTTGVILSDQFKSLDWNSRGAVTVDSVSSKTVSQVTGNISKILNI
ncbi:mRNA-degrading endonuclease [Rosenbergiella sp. S61]|uniref:mRNA-degrading endonuclease n=1 Tax=Rosenbergiella gaditana TaxID=2726987 RepID=A0ABS5T053_9GAMM|nr:type II toxin-antitoxin system PemK/MazF family toxin [Rosenbergiella gaditana]MBT0725731.1 mRNA-degrading endonuclease [Rosenbergiella gaditana]